MHHTNSRRSSSNSARSLWGSELLNALGTEHENSLAARLYPTPPEPTDRLDSISFPDLLGFPQSPTPMSYHHSVSPASSLGMFSPRDNELGPILGDIGPNAGAGDQVVTVSTSFHPGSYPLESDLVFSSSDGVFFHGHSEIINKTSPSALASLTSFSIPGVEGAVIPLPEPATIINIIFHELYQTSCAPNSPTVDDLIEAVDKMPRYGIQPKSTIRPPSPLYALLLSYAPLQPMDIYALAAHHHLSGLAEHVSSHLLSYPLDTIDDNLAARIGPSYLKRLFLLHLERVNVAKKILLQPPSLHPASKTCGFDDQKKLTRAWGLGSTYLAWDVKPDLSNQRIQSVFEPLGANLTCTACQEMLRKRIREVLVGWAAAKRTI